MAADDDKNESPDPWADLAADDLGAEGDEVSFSFVEKTPSVPEGGTPLIEEPSATSPPGVEDEDADVGAWLSAPEGEAAEAIESETSTEEPETSTPLSVFAPEEAASDQASSSSIEIGTGFSGIDMVAEGEGSNPPTVAEEGDEWSGLEEPAAVATAAVAAAASAPKVVSKPRAKGGGLGPMIGVVAGGVMAIPITMAILLWGFQKDPFGVAKQLPESMSFLLPQKFRPGFKKQAGGLSNLAAAPSLDDLAAAGPGDDGATAGGGEAVEPEPPAAEPSEEPVPEPLAEPASLDAAVAAVDPLTPPVDDAAKPEEPQAAPEDPLFPDPDAPAAATPDPLTVAAVTPAAPVAEPAVAAEPAAPPPPPPLDTAALEAAVVAATSALEAAAAAENHTELAGKTLLVGWYKSLARAADELVKLQNEAADSGRPLDGVPEQVATIYEGLAKEKDVAAALPLLARHWLAYARRDSEGILLPVTFDSAKKVGPYWRSKVTLVDGDHSRELAIISRSEPAAVAGEQLLVTGVVFDGDVIWAAEVRPLPVDPAAADF